MKQITYKYFLQSNRTVISNTSIISSNLFPFTVSDHNKKDHYL